jgi:integrase
LCKWKPLWVERLFKAARKASKRDYAILLLAYRHGLRVSEIGLLKRSDIDRSSHRIRLSRLKNSLAGEHRLQPDEAQAIRSYLRTRNDSLPHLFLSRNRRPIGRHALNLLMKRYGEEAKIPPRHRHFHVLKHSIAVHMISADGDVIHVQDWLGHRDIKNTMEYARLVSPKREQVMEKLLRSGEIA